jgi:hypothetical protein
MERGFKTNDKTADRIKSLQVCLCVFVCVRARACARVTNAKTADLVKALQDSENMLTTLLKAPPSCIQRDTPPHTAAVASRPHQITSTTITSLNHDIYENYPDA